MMRGRTGPFLGHCYIPADTGHKGGGQSFRWAELVGAERKSHEEITFGKGNHEPL